MTVLVTGQCGYIGSHVAVNLAQRGYDFIGLDNLHTGLMSNNPGPCVVGDIRRIEDIKQVFNETKIDAVIHMAALTSVPESMEKKDEYEEVNTEGTLNLLKVMKEYGCKKLIFSSTASIYKQSNERLKESDPAAPLNNYALTKYWAEQIIAKQDWLEYVIFRYFNVIGYRPDYDKSHEYSKTLLVPALIRAYENNEPVSIYGNGYPVKRQNPDDHTCVRDYIDVRDVARAHVDALKYMENTKAHDLFNLGTSYGHSVLELIEAFERANGIKLQKEIKPPRKGDPSSLIASNSKARELLYWCPLTPLENSLRLTEVPEEHTYNE